jgi:hypothetical protein
VPRGDLDLAALADPVVGRRHRRHAAAIPGMAHREDFAGGLVEPGAAGKAARRLRVIGGALAGHHARMQPMAHPSAPRASRRARYGRDGNA